MDYCYAEYSYKKNVSLRQRLFRAFLIALAVAFGVFSMFAQVFIPVTILWIVIAVFYSRSLNCEYEYILCDNELAIDRIINNAKRKSIVKYNLDEMIAFEKASDHFFTQFDGQKFKTKKFYSYLNNDDVYALMLESGGIKTCVLLQVNDELLQLLGHRYPQIVGRR